MLSHVRPVMRDDSSYSRDQPVNLRQFTPRHTSLAAVPRQPALDVRGRGPVAAVPANVNKQYWSALFDQLIVQQYLLRVSFQLDRCQQLDSVTSTYHYRSSSSRLSTPDRCGIKSTRTDHHSRHRHHIHALLLIDTFKVALKTL